MGIATALIGVELDKKNTVETIRERGCKHEESDNKFCAECGEAMWNKREVVIKELRMVFEDWEEEECYSKETILEDYQLGFTTDEHRVFLGKQVTVYADTQSDEAKMIALPVMEEISQDIAYIKQALMNFLKPLNLWDESKFGIWAIACYVS